MGWGEVVFIFCCLASVPVLAYTIFIITQTNKTQSNRERAKKLINIGGDGI